jgi:hypothetical protein
MKLKTLNYLKPNNVNHLRIFKTGQSNLNQFNVKIQMTNDTFISSFFLILFIVILKIYLQYH